tara:strand:+ start:71 stop:577 length:507 start_codon:yes stop_codon:yes gene_type:complete
MTSKKKLKNKSGFSLLELVIVIGLMAVVTIPAYMSLVNGYKLFHDESTYQSVLSDVQAFNNNVNARVRLAGFRNFEILTTEEQLDEVPGLAKVVDKSNIEVLRVENYCYYLSDGSLYSYNDNDALKMADHILSFDVSISSDSQLLIIEIVINYDGRQEEIEYSIYTRY